MKSIALAAVALCVATTTIHAQRPGTAAPRNWATAYGQMYTNISRLNDPDSDSRWLFDDHAWGFGARLHREVGQGLLLGVDGSFARPSYERRDLVTDLILAEGTATIATLLANGRFSYSGSSQLGFYLTGGIGTVAYSLEDLGGWNADLALNAGTGLEYRFQPNAGLALEWGRIWGYHEKENLGGGNQQHSMLKLALRFGF